MLEICPYATQINDTVLVFLDKLSELGVQKFIWLWSFNVMLHRRLLGRGHASQMCFDWAEP